MRPRLYIATALFTATAAVFVSTNSAGALPPAPKCFDISSSTFVDATKWLTTPGTLTGTPGDDVLVGTTGSDTINGLGGNDVICGAPLAAFTDPIGDPDKVDGGAGDDSIIAKGTVQGGSGEDWVSVTGTGSKGDGGSGDDSVIASDSARGDGGSGNDELNSMGAAALNGGSGSDNVVNTSGDPKIDCGAAYDFVYSNSVPVTDIRRCEGTIIRPN